MSELKVGDIVERKSYRCHEGGVVLSVNFSSPYPYGVLWNTGIACVHRHGEIILRTTDGYNDFLDKIKDRL